MQATLRRLTTLAALAGCTLAWMAGPSLAAPAIPSGTLNSGAADGASANYRLSSSLGHPVHAAALGGSGHRLSTGLWTTVITLTRNCLLDIDGNGKIEALTDGLMIMRAMFGLTGTAVTGGALGVGAQWTAWSDIQPRIRMNALDVDGNGTTDALTDGLLLMRAMFGMTGTAVTAGAVAAGAPRAAWTDIRAHVNATCGTNLAQ